jgi:hypothetical protein
MGINGYLIAIYISETFNTVFSVTRLLCITKVSAKLLKWVCMPLICILTATYLARFFFSSVLTLAFSATVNSIFYCTITALIYFGLLTLTGTVNREELSWGRGLLLRERNALQK